MSDTITSFTKSFTKILTLSIEQGFFVSVNILLSSPDFKTGGWGWEGRGRGKLGQGLVKSYELWV